MGCEPSKIKCEIHQKTINYFCNSDESPICSDCGTIGDHKNHKIVKLEDKKMELHKKINNSLDKCNEGIDTIYKIKPMIKTQNNKIEEGIQEIKTNIEDGFEFILESIKEKRNQLLQETETLKSTLKSESKSNKNILEDLKNGLQMNSRNLKNFKKRFNSFIKNYKTNEFTFSDIEDILNEITNMNTTFNDLQSRKIISPFLMFSPLTNEIDHLQLTFPPQFYASGKEDRSNLTKDIMLNQISNQFKVLEHKDNERKLLSSKKKK